ncbi:hypothetical protein [Flavobacterium caeni]|uniref:Uncharacterized protein n=1 Tax=Flavobacterium caeni TaxID=490189 RepID=A0A1G5KEL1_9FLAO|nr:hypothetical protein [Flavobacterium caeni]SCY98379.1 hypothetical protein SAMN02927903_03239 [Flavobacterium caeni]
MKRINFLIAFILLSNLAFSQSQTTTKSGKTSIPTHKGWRNLSWDSTETDVKQKYGNELTILQTVGKYGANGEWYCPFQIDNYELGYVNFTVSFLFDEKTKKLAQINVTKEDPIDMMGTIQELEVSLTEKYGKPSIKLETPKYIAKWSFPELDIKLSYLDIKSLEKQLYKSIVLTYQKPRKSNLDKF